MGVGGDRDRFRAPGGGSFGFLGLGPSRRRNGLGRESLGRRQRRRRWNDNPGWFRSATAGQQKNKNQNKNQQGSDGEGSEPGGSPAEVG
jgi:hypothetical protein